MANIDLSVIIPSKNNKNKISKIIRDVASSLTISRLNSSS